MITKHLLQKLNEQIGLEFESANIYLQMSSWCAANGLDGCASFLREHTTEEMGHMTRLFDYVNEIGEMAIIPEIPKPRHEYENVRELFAATLEHEKFITKKINELTAAAFEDKDFSTFNFLQWYVAEQHEEEALFKKILDLVDMVGHEGRGLYYLDKEITSISAGVVAGPSAGAGEPGA
jgi:ferritin